MKMDRSRLHVCLVRPLYPGNVGAAARAMKNFGFHRLTLVSESDPRHVPEAAWLAHGAEDVLGQARLCATLDEAVGSAGLVIGTSSRRGRRSRETVDPEEMAAILASGWAGGPACLLFGPEDRGLSVQELSRCQWVVRLPTRAECPSMNLSHAVALCCYVLGRSLSPEAGRPRPRASSPEDLRRFLAASGGFLQEIGFSLHDGTQGRNARNRLTRVLIRAAPGKTELMLLWKLLRQVERLLRAGGGSPRPGREGSSLPEPPGSAPA